MRYARGESIRRGNEIHPYHEILFFLDGGGKMLTEEFERSLEREALCIIPKNTYHRFQIQDESRYTRFVLSFDDTAARGIGAYLTPCRTLQPPNGDIRRLLYKLRDTLASKSTPAADILLEGALLMLMAELVEHVESSSPCEPRRDRGELDTCIRYVNESFAKKITAASVAEHVGMSESALSRLFRERLGISVYRYITEKRLIHAHSLIELGGAPTKIYTDCGFGDYATFYKAYRNMFGKPPSAR